ncbi:hypothetical protein JCM10296v2_003030 [Rhodotorula toruloides]
MPWKPPAGQEWYYSIPSPWAQHSLVSQLLHRPPAGDRTWGRKDVPRSPEEQQIRDTHGHRDGQVFLNEARLDWVTYQVWEPTKGAQSRDADLVFVHGINDYGGKFSNHAKKFLDAGYRVIVPDLPSHGRSTGIHVHCPNMEALADAVYEVIKDIMLEDSKLVQETGGSVTQQRKVFVAGQSLGGFTATLTCLKYGAPLDTSLPSASSTSFRPTVSGGVILCPMLQIAPDSRPSYAVELAARALASVAGPLPFANANKGRNSEDPEVEEQFEMDPQTYGGKLRIATGLAILEGILDIDKKLPHLRVPFLLCHGTGDRVTSYKGSQKLYEEAESKDKEIKLYDGYEHILLRKGRDEADDVRRQTVLNDMLDWLNRH